MTYSHRDHRIDRELRRAQLLLLAGLTAVTLLALWGPWIWVRAAAVVGFAGVGAVYLFRSERLTTSYRRDLAAFEQGESISGMVRVECGHDVGLDRYRSNEWGPSPHRRIHPPEAETAVDPEWAAPLKAPSSSARP